MWIFRSSVLNAQVRNFPVVREYNSFSTLCQTMLVNLVSFLREITAFLDWDFEILSVIRLSFREFSQKSQPVSRELVTSQCVQRTDEPRVLVAFIPLLRCPREIPLTSDPARFWVDERSRGEGRAPACHLIDRHAPLDESLARPATMLHNWPSAVGTLVWSFEDFKF